MATLIKRIHLEHYLMGAGLSVLLFAVSGRLSINTAGFSELDIQLAGIAAGLLVLFGLIRKAWRDAEGRRWLWFVYGAVVTVGLQLFAHVFMERFSDLYLSLWLQAFKAGLI